MKQHKFSALVKFKSGKSYMEFSDSKERLKKLILVDGVKKVEIFNQIKMKKVITLKSK